MRINNTGNVGIGTSNPTERLDVTGNIKASGDITAFSDATLKTNIRTLDSALETINKLRGVRYNRKETGEVGIGVVAQEVQKVLPEVVKQGSKLSVAYGNMVGLLIEGIKEQQTEINSLKDRISRLEKLLLKE